MKKSYSPAFKAQIVRELLKEEKSISQLAAEHKLHPNQLYRWRDIALAGLPTLFEQDGVMEQATKDAAHEHQLQDLYAEIGKLTTQLTWLKKSCRPEPC
jgi:putative transposase